MRRCRRRARCRAAGAHQCVSHGPCRVAWSTLSRDCGPRRRGQTIGRQCSQSAQGEPDHPGPIDCWKCGSGGSAVTRLSEIQSHIASMDELLDIVGAMRSLAGMRVQESQHALPGIRSYADAMANAIGSALLLLPRPGPDQHQDHGSRALILCMAEHGFVGGFNERMLEAAEAILKPSDLLFVLGSRGASLALERGRKLQWMKPMATRLAGAPDTINRL